MQGWMGQGRERVARESDASFGVRGENGRGVGVGVRPRCGLGRPGGIGSAIWRPQGDGRRFGVGGGGRLCARETALGAPSNLRKARGSRETRRSRARMSLELRDLLDFKTTAL